MLLRLHAGPSAVAVIVIGVVIQAHCSHADTGREGGGFERVVGKEAVHGPDYSTSLVRRARRHLDFHRRPGTTRLHVALAYHLLKFHAGQGVTGETGLPPARVKTRFHSRD